MGEMQVDTEKSALKRLIVETKITVNPITSLFKAARMPKNR